MNDRRLLDPYVPPADDEPLDAVQLALVRMFVRIIVRDLREELRAGANSVGDPGAGASLAAADNPDLGAMVDRPEEVLR